MRFTINRDELARAEILEFKGEFERLEELEMEIKDRKVLFKTSYLTGEKKEVPEHIIFQIKDKKMEALAIADEYFLFDKPLKYIPKKKSK
ncbi:hypothetical protein NEMIN01_0426 [Nematocida minor]|uniref:uncharacterized protein n=1 Tax=Nematocida minor TaxID=1912983 RepID=UPI00222053F6|nr:uncharacterized protein NEMIN01_0426 [Nematocida minor]KAI5189363.1 hypothetical protein NEMIN01_0426 [Nematocida minor]